MAAEPGFPWQAPSRDPEKEGVTIPEQNAKNIRPEEQQREEVSASPVKTTPPLQDTQLRNQSNLVYGKAHRGSGRGPPRVSYTIPAPPSASGTSKPTSPLPVRTVPRKSCFGD